MFSSKSERGKRIWVFIDLLVVITGVYIAFLIQSKAAESRDRKEKIKIYSALKMELEELRVAFPQFAQSNEGFIKEISHKELYDISSWRFIEPQYGYQIIEYGISIQNTETIDFNTYEELRKLLVSIKQLEHTERLITEIASEYQFLIPELEETHPSNLDRKANNRFRLIRFRLFLNSRIRNLQRTSESAKPLLSHVNEVLGPKLRKETDKKYIVQTIRWFSEEEQAIGLM
ncbi:MAG: hypothetical protein AAF519_19440 [Bacteroidota bacterium]